MLLNVDPTTVVVFDLDDTLYKEVDFVYSAFRAISRVVAPQTGHSVHEEMCEYFKNGDNPLTRIKERYKLGRDISEFVSIYRHHKPGIEPSPGAVRLLRGLARHGAPLGVITDGREITQKNKLIALGLHDRFDKIVISEVIGSKKPAVEGYILFERAFPSCDYVYIGDNFHKDFVTANRRGWSTIGLLDDGRNIHSQEGHFEQDYLPQHYVESLSDIRVSRRPHGTVEVLSE
jgi:putative hydrolase of the HAD superfamily